MKYFIELNDEDIIQIIAERFDVSPENVSVRITTETVGQGLCERDRCVAKVVIEGLKFDIPGSFRI